MKPKSTLSTTLIIRSFFSIVIIIFVLGIIAGIAEYFLVREESRREIANTTAGLQLITSQYLAEKKIEGLLELVKTEMEDQNILAIVIQDVGNNYYTGAVRNFKWNIIEFFPITGLEYLERAATNPVKINLYKNERKIGRIVFYLSDYLINQKVITIFIKYSILLLLLSVILFIIMAVSIHKMLNQPLHKIMNHLELIKKGTLIPIPDVKQGKDEITIISKDINILINRYAALADDLNTISESISKDSAQNFQVTQEFSDIINIEATAIEQISAALIQSASSVKNISNNTKESVDKLSRGAQKAKEGFELIEKITNSIVKIEDRSGNIKKSLALIYDITEETDMLALNASIEAAKAGEYGKGFAVVAEQIRKLAEKSQDTAGEIEKRINENNEEVVEAKDIINNSQATINEVLETTVASDQILAQISIAINEQAAGQNEMLNAIDNINTSMNKIVDRVSIIEVATKAIESSSEQLAEISKPFQTEANIAENDIIEASGGNLSPPATPQSEQRTADKPA